MHHTRKKFRNTKIKNTLGYWKHSNIDWCLKNVELLIQALDQKLIDFDKEKQNVYEKYDVTIMTKI